MARGNGCNVFLAQFAKKEAVYKNRQAIMIGGGVLIVLSLFSFMGNFAQSSGAIGNGSQFQFVGIFAVIFMSIGFMGVRVGCLSKVFHEDRLRNQQQNNQWVQGVGQPGPGGAVIGVSGVEVYGQGPPLQYSAFSTGPTVSNYNQLPTEYGQPSNTYGMSFSNSVQPQQTFNSTTVSYPRQNFAPAAPALGSLEVQNLEAPPPTYWDATKSG